MEITRTELDRAMWRALAEATIARFSWACDAYCLMPNHFHFIVDAPLERISRGMQRLNGRWAEQFNACYGRTGHLFGERFAARVVGDEEHYEAAARYVLDNPVRAGLCERAEDWPWSGGRVRASLD